MRRYFVYILANRRWHLYVGVTSNLLLRLQQHRTGQGGAFTRHYQLSRLVHVEECASILDAIRREKQIKGWRREKKVALVESGNAAWADLSGWSGQEGIARRQPDPSLRSG